MSENNPENNPIKAKLTPKQFDASVKFYEADSVLSDADRFAIADDMQSILFKTSAMGYGSAILAFFTPTIYGRMSQKPTGVLPNPPNGIRPVIQKPFLSFVIALSTLLAVHQQGAKYYFNQQREKLEGIPEKIRQKNVWHAIDYHQCGLFYLYYKRSSTDASFKVDDPRTFTSENLHKVRYHPPHVEQIQKNHGLLSHWDQVRVQNGFGIDATQAEDQQPMEVADPFDLRDIEPESEQDSDVDSTKTEFKSKWDEIRKK
jgi:hypothetical protein